MSNSESSPEAGQPERRLLSICMVTCDQERASQYISHHGKAFAGAGIENLIFCSPEMLSALEKQAASQGWSARFLADGLPSGPGRKRNELLRVSQGIFCIFFDDDSLLCDPIISINRILHVLHEQANEWFLLTAVYTDKHGSEHVAWPQKFSLLGAGSGIEWNQIFARDLLLSEGGWNEKFCIGEQWRSGEAMILMGRLWSKGVTPFMLPNIKVRHPAQIDESDANSVSKIRRYRYAIGAVIVEEWRTLGVLGIAVWCVRCCLLAPLAGSLDLMRGKRVSAAVRLNSPIDFINGVRERLAEGN